jgi:hypothetical protein
MDHDPRAWLWDVHRAASHRGQQRIFAGPREQTVLEEVELLSEGWAIN